MKKHLILVSILMVLLSCVTEKTVFTKDTLPKFDSSTATAPLMVKVISNLINALEPIVKNDYPHTHTFEAYKRLISKEVDIILSLEPTRELIGLAKMNDVTFESVPIGRDAFVFLVNVVNPVNDLTIDQIQKIYTGQITNWRELGGADEQIIAFQRQHESGSQAIMENIVMKGLKMLEAPSRRISTGMGDINERLGYDNSKNAIGYNIYYFTHYMEPNPLIKMVSVNGIFPAKESIIAKTYPFTGDICAIIRSDEETDSSVRKIIKWLLSKEGQRLVEEGGYVPIY